MKITVAPELNGGRLQVPGAPGVWVVLHGVRRHVARPRVYDALFADVDVVSMPSLEHIQRGADLNEGTCLARAKGDSAIFLVTGFPDTDVQKHHVANYETFAIYGFNEAAVADVPRIVLAGVPTGPEIRCG